MSTGISRDFVICHCKKCAGAEQLRSTRAGHYAQQRRRASTKVTRTKKEALKLAKQSFTGAKWSTSLGTGPSVAIVDPSVEPEGDKQDEDVPMHDAQRTSDVTQAMGIAPVAPPAQAGASILTPAATQLWAFVSRSIVPPPSPLGPTCPSLSIAPLAAHTPAVDLTSSAIIVDVDDVDVRNVQQVNDNPEQQRLCEDDDWEDCDEDEGNDTPVVLPPLVASSEAERSRQTPASLVDGVTAAPPVSATVPVPLDSDAMARVNDTDPFLAHFVSPSSSWSAWDMTHPSVVLTMIMVAWLHLAAHLPFRFCDVVLSVVGFVLADAGQANITPLLRTSLSGCLSALRLDPSIKLYPTCPSCLEPHPESVNADVDARCSICSHPLFRLEAADTGRGRKRGKGKRAQAYLRTPAKSIAEQLGALLAQPGMEEAMESWRQRSRLRGWLSDFFDGAISKALLGPDGLPFFKHDAPVDPEGELRIGLALGVDWFSYLRSLISPSHTSCPMSLNVVNLPPYLRYRASNLLLSMIIPGPKETTPDQTQRYLRVLVNELIRLWHIGVVLPTYRNARGRLVRVILVGVFCDKPAAHKIGGFGSHGHTFFCTRDWITQGLKASVAAFTRGGFLARTDVHHRKMMREYQACVSQNARDAYAKSYATRWSELARLPYFDTCRMVVVDPMHNLFLGVVKTHFYHIWVQLKIFRKSCEIRRLHEILAELQLPSKLGRLPKLIGEPAGGSLTADQWLILATVVGPMVLPTLWDDLHASGDRENDDDFLAKRREAIQNTASARKVQRQARRVGKGSTKKTGGLRAGARGQAAVASAPLRRSGRIPKPTEKGKDLELEADDAGAHEESDDDGWADDEDVEDDSTRPPQLHPRDLENFLKLCSALKLYLAESIDEAQLAQADALMREYCLELVELYGPEIIRPNHHYATHTAEFVRDYGPLREFWTFLFERLNKILKGYKTNNHEGGEIETTFFREFHRAAQMHRLLTEGCRHPTHATFGSACRMMLGATADNRGTLQQLAEELDETFSDDNISMSFSARSATDNMPGDVYWTFLAYMNRRFPLQPYHSELAVPTNPSSKLLPNLATLFDYVVVSGHRYHAARRATNAVNSLVLVRVSPAGQTWIGELQDVVLYEHAPAGLRELFGVVRWLRAAHDVSLQDTTWSSCCALFALQLWEADAFLDTPGDASPSPIVALADLLAPVARHDVTIQARKYWITMPLSRSPIRLTGVNC